MRISKEKEMYFVEMSYLTVFDIASSHSFASQWKWKGDDVSTDVWFQFNKANCGIYCTSIPILQSKIWINRNVYSDWARSDATFPFLISFLSCFCHSNLQLYFCSVEMLYILRDNRRIRIDGFVCVFFSISLLVKQCLIYMYFADGW